MRNHLLWGYLNFKKSLKKNNWLTIVVVILMFLSQYSCFGNSQTFFKLTVENGLSNNLVNTIYKDSLGFIWFGTLEGLDRYDGEEIKAYSSKFRTPIENVYAITEDYSKNFWVGTGKGLFYYNNSSGFFEKVELGKANLSIKTLVVSPDNQLFVGTNNGLYIVDTKTKNAKLVLIKNSGYEKMNNITGGFFDNHGNIWMSTVAGLVQYSYSANKHTFYRFNKGSVDAYNSFSSICYIGNKIYLGTNNKGIVEFDLITKTFSQRISLNNNIILTLHSDNKELLFVGTNGAGLKVVNVKTMQIETFANIENDLSSISSNSVYSFYLDENNRYWIGTYSGGVNYSINADEKFKLHSFLVEYPEINKSIRSFYFAIDGSYYLGTRNGFVDINKNGRVRLFKSEQFEGEGLRSNIILTVFPYMGDILIGTYGGGISRFVVKSQKVMPFGEGNKFKHGNIYSFKTDAKGNLWISTFEGLYKYSSDLKELANYTTENSELHSNEIFEITFDSKGRLWVGTMKGFDVFQPKGEVLEKVQLPLFPNNTFKTNYIYEDLDANIWVCTERGGIMVFDPDLKSYKQYKNTDGLPDNSVCSIIESSSGIYWISTLKGFCQLKLQQEQFTQYSLSDGLPSLVFTPTTMHLSEEGIIWVGNENGLIYFSPSDIDEAMPLAKIQLTKFYLFGKEEEPGIKSVLKQSIEFTKEIILEKDMNSIGFKFTTLNFIKPEDNNYLYKLEGYDKEWQHSQKSNTAFYQNLKPGTYIFVVRNVYNFNKNTPSTARVKVVIQKSFIVPITLAVIGIVLLLLIVFSKHIKGIARIRELLLERVEEVKKYESSKLSDTQSMLIATKIEECMQEKKPYLNADLKLADLAKELNCSTHDISQVLNQSINMGFSNFVNKYRVQEVKKRLADTKYEKYTLFAIAQQCGFNSKTSFYRIFKNYTSKTPSDYLKELKQK